MGPTQVALALRMKTRACDTNAAGGNCSNCGSVLADLLNYLYTYAANAGSSTAMLLAGVNADTQDAIRDNIISNFYEDDEAEPPNYATHPAHWLAMGSDAANK
jgi:hypothetical protein